MTQLNLLPDVKLQYLRATRNKRLVMGISALVIVASVGILLLLVTIVYGFQKTNLSHLNNDISIYNNQLKQTADLDKILTIQNQLTALTNLHESKPAVTRLYDYLKQVTPSAASITQLDVDFSAFTMTITGTAPSLDMANTYIDTLKFTTYQKMVDSKPDGNSAKAFSQVVLSSFSRSNNGAAYTITLSYDKAIFDGSNAIQLTVPHIISTRSLTEQPTDLFKNAPSPSPSSAKGGQ